MDLIRFKEKRVSEEIHQIESAVFRRLVKHLRDNTAIQNIDIMETAGFCRNCLSRLFRLLPKSEIFGTLISTSLIYFLPAKARRANPTIKIAML